MCLVMLAGTYFWCDAVLTSRQGSLLDAWGLKSAYLQYDCFGSATARENDSSELGSSECL